MNRYRDGIEGERCMFCHSFVAYKNGEKAVTVPEHVLDNVIEFVALNIGTDREWTSGLLLDLAHALGRPLKRR